MTEATEAAPQGEAGASPAPRVSRARRGLPTARTILLLLLAGLTALRVAHLAAPFFARGWENWSFYDFRLWRAGLDQYEKSGRLYDTDQPGYFLPGSRSLYKYPPTFAALMKPFTHLPQSVAARSFLILNALCLAGFLAALFASLRVRAWKACLLSLLLLHWQPVWEVLSDLQMELIILALLALSLFLEERRKDGMAGSPLGAAGAFKVYPWLLLSYFAARRQGRALLFGGAGALAALALACLAFPARLSIEFFTRILPRLGGTSLSYDNVSGLAVISRLCLQLRGGVPSAETLDEATLETFPSPGLRPLALVLFLLAAFALLFWTVRALRRPHTFASALSLSTCLLLALIPTSWLSYQALLALPLLVAAAAVSADGRSRGSWILLGSAILFGGAINSYDRSYSSFPAALSLLRSSIPFILWTLHLRLMRLRPASGII